jgi:hypothetical protein
MLFVSDVFFMLSGETKQLSMKDIIPCSVIDNSLNTLEITVL